MVKLDKIYQLKLNIFGVWTKRKYTNSILDFSQYYNIHNVKFSINHYGHNGSADYNTDFENLSEKQVSFMEFLRKYI